MNRELWADKAKFIGIILMLLGHNSLANKHIFDWIYSFHMPLFFVLSGYFTSNKPIPFSQYLKKNARQLLIPYICFYLITLPFSYYGLYLKGSAGYNGLSEFILKPICGFFTIESTQYSFNANYALWFFVTLFVVKMIFYIPIKFKCSWKSLLLTSFGCIATLLFISSFDCYIYGRFDRALIAFPIFAIGYVLRVKTTWIYSILKLSTITKVALGIALYAIVYIGAMCNGHVSFGGINYGNSLLLTYLIAIIGTIATICISDSLPNFKQILTIWGGTAILLGLHSPIQEIVKRLGKILFNIPIHDYSLINALLMIIIIAAIHIPIINYCNKNYLFIGENKKIVKSSIKRQRI